MWVKFWHRIGSCHSAKYEFVSDRESKESLQEMAREYAHDISYSENIYPGQYGFEIVEVLSKELKQELICKWTRVRDNANYILKNL